MDDTLSRDNISENPDTEIALTIYPHDVLHIQWGAILSQPKGMTLAPFTLEDGCYGLLFVRHGTLCVEIGGQWHTVREGQTLIVRPNETVVGTVPHDSDLYCPWLAFKVDSSQYGGREDPIKVPRVADTSVPARLGELIMLLSEDYQDSQSAGIYQPLSRKSCEYLLRSILSRLDPTELELAAAAPYYVVLAERAKDYIRMNLHNDLSSEAVAQALECSAGYLRWAFRKANNEGIREFVLRLRMAKARHFLIADPRLTITQIARACGEDNLSYFTYTFTRFHGIPPTEYRATHSKTRVDIGI